MSQDRTPGHPPGDAGAPTLLGSSHGPRGGALRFSRKRWGAQGAQAQPKRSPRDPSGATELSWLSFGTHQKKKNNMKDIKREKNGAVTQWGPTSSRVFSKHATCGLLSGKDGGQSTFVDDFPFKAPFRSRRESHHFEPLATSAALV